MSVRVIGAKELRRALKEVDGGLKDLRAAHSAAAKIVAAEARVAVPRRSGALARTIRAAGSRQAAVVRAGSGIKYAGVIHFGNPVKKGRLGVIRPQPFIYEARDRRIREVIDVFDQRVSRIINKEGLS